MDGNFGRLRMRGRLVIVEIVYHCGGGGGGRVGGGGGGGESESA